MTTSVVALPPAGKLSKTCYFKLNKWPSQTQRSLRELTTDQHTEKGRFLSIFDVQTCSHMILFESLPGPPGSSLPPYAPIPNGTLLNEIVNDTKTPVKVRIARFSIPPFHSPFLFLNSASRKKKKKRRGRKTGKNF